MPNSLALTRVASDEDATSAALVALESAVGGVNPALKEGIGSSRPSPSSAGEIGEIIGFLANAFCSNGSLGSMRSRAFRRQPSAITTTGVALRLRMNDSLSDTIRSCFGLPAVESRSTSARFGSSTRRMRTARKSTRLPTVQRGVPAISARRGQ